VKYTGGYFKLLYMLIQLVEAIPVNIPVDESTDVNVLHITYLYNNHNENVQASNSLDEMIITDTQ
jgi:hypothetical protein